MRIEVATDGSALSNPGPSGWGWYVDDGNWQAGGLGTGTNNIGELTAILQAALSLPQDIPVLCLADSQYAIHCVSRTFPNSWLRGWERSGKINDDSALKNAALIRATVAALDARSAEWTFQWVKGHRGHPMNEAVDRRCNAAAHHPAGSLFGPGWQHGF